MMKRIATTMIQPHETDLTLSESGVSQSTILRVGVSVLRRVARRGKEHSLLVVERHQGNHHDDDDTAHIVVCKRLLSAHKQRSMRFEGTCCQRPSRLPLLLTSGMPRRGLSQLAHTHACTST